MAKASEAPEAEWLALGDPGRVLERLGDQLTRRKHSLFACACCRHMHALLPGLPYLPVLDAAERGDGALELLRACRAGPETSGTSLTARSWAYEAVDNLCRNHFVEARQHAARAARDQARGRDWSAAMKQQVLILCDVLGHRLHPGATIDPAWLRWNDGTVQKMAHAIYEDNTFADVPILADALEEAGCADAAILHHCRAKMRHYRGCWVIDALLGKS
jgi:hypothetical protein